MLQLGRNIHGTITVKDNVSQVIGPVVLHAIEHICVIEPHAIEWAEAEGNQSIWIVPQRLSLAQANGITNNCRQNRAHEVVHGLIPGHSAPKNAGQGLVLMQPRTGTPPVHNRFDPANA